ncbi:winged helix-turn-helix transcriptional regulator [Streptomyces sp. NP160]|uniref:winged helix-turn-helix transcriptional regulator n=1 Tax=Streptomyces sp. NP160 TaxID=2586637 RepID=UPI0035A652A1
MVPPKVEYSLTDEAVTLTPLLRQLSDWGDGWLNRRGITLRQDCDVISAASANDENAEGTRDETLIDQTPVAGPAPDGNTAARAAR